MKTRDPSRAGVFSIAASVLLLLLGGCAQTVWVKAGATSAESEAAMERCLSDAYLQAPSAPSVRHSWQRCRGAVLYDMFRSRLQRGLRDVTRAIHAPNEHIIRRQCQDTLADIPAMHAGSRMVRAEPKRPCRRAPGTRRRLDAGLRYSARGTERTRSAPLRPPVSPMVAAGHSVARAVRGPDKSAERLWFPAYGRLVI